MKLSAVILALVFGSPLFSHANCIGLSTAKDIAKVYLTAQGETVFPEAYLGKTPSEKETITTKAVNDLKFIGAEEGSYFDYFASVHYYRHGDASEESFVTISCQGTAGVYHQRIN